MKKVKLFLKIIFILLVIYVVYTILNKETFLDSVINGKANITYYDIYGIHLNIKGEFNDIENPTLVLKNNEVRKWKSLQEL